jgi:hypothetical protein
MKGLEFRLAFGTAIVLGLGLATTSARADITWAGNPVISLDADDLELGPATGWTNKVGLGGDFTVVATQPEPVLTPLPLPEVKQNIPGPAGVTRKYVEFHRGGGLGYGDDASAMLWDYSAPPEITAGHSFSVEGWIYLTTEIELQTYFSIGRRHGDTEVAPWETTNNLACAAGYVTTGGNSNRAVGMDTPSVINLTWSTDPTPTFYTPLHNYIAVTYDGDAQMITVYLNGDFNNSMILSDATYPGLDIATEQPVYIGAMWYNGNSKYIQQGLQNGGISKLRVHDGVLSDVNVLNNYEFERPQYQVGILSFGMPGEQATITGTDIVWSVPFGTDVKALAPTYTLSPLTTGVPESGSQQDFTNPVTYTITADGGAAKTYTVTVQVRDKYDGLIAYSYNDTQGTTFLDPLANLLAVTPSGSILQAADIAHDGDVFASTFPGLVDNETFAMLWTGWFDVSVDGPGDYTFGTASDDGSVVYLDLDGDGTFLSPDELVVNSNFEQSLTIRTGTATLDMGQVRIAIAYYENGGGNTMIARFKKGTALDYSQLDPINGKTHHFVAKLESDPKNSEKDILTFGLEGMPATIAGDRINWTLPAGTDVTALAPTYIVSLFASGSPASGSTQDFTDPVEYTITADDGSTKVYTVTVVPRPPTDLVATPGVEEVSLAWQAPAEGSRPTGYQVLRAGKKIADVPATVRTYVDTPLEAGRRYCFNVKSVIGDVASVASSSSCTTPTAAEVPNAPTDLAATGGIGQVSLAWAAPAAGLAPTGYEVYRAAVKIADVPATPTTYVDADPALVPGTSYCYTVKSVAGDKTSDPSNESCAIPQSPQAGFRRGDADGSGKLDLTDAIATLQFLYMGYTAPGCKDAADTDDSGVLDLTDAIASLQFQFMGGTPPAAPGPTACGPDPTPGDQYTECTYTNC